MAPDFQQGQMARVTLVARGLNKIEDENRLTTHNLYLAALAEGAFGVPPVTCLER